MKRAYRSNSKITATSCDDSAGGGFSVNPKKFLVSSKEKRLRKFIQNIFPTLGTWGFGGDPLDRDSKLSGREEEKLSSCSDDGDVLTDQQINFPA